MNNVKISTEKLKEYFYNRFKNTDYKTTLLHLKNVNERERIINELAENQEEAYYYNNIYEKTLKNISLIFKNNDEYITAKRQEEMQQQAQQQNMNQKKNIMPAIIKLTLKFLAVLFFPCSICLFLMYVIWPPAFYMMSIFALIAYIYAIKQTIAKYKSQ